MKTDWNNNKIVLEKFNCLDKEEILVAKKIIEKYIQKIEKITEYTRLKLEMKVYSKTKVTEFEVKGHLECDKERVLSEKRDLNPFVALNEVLEKLLKEIKHKIERK
jgi:ribosome-associated translation inhibitor RaiA